MFFFVFVLLCLTGAVFGSISTTCDTQPNSRTCYEDLFKLSYMTYYSAENILNALGIQSYSRSCQPHSSTGNFIYLNKKVMDGTVLISNVEVSIVREGRSMYIAFAGSDMGEVLKNLIPSGVSYMQTKLTRVTWDHLRPVQQDIIDCYKSLKDEVDNVYLMGYSLGGGVAELTAGILTNGPSIFPSSNTSVYSFNGVRPGDSNFASLLQRSVKSVNWIRERFDCGQYYPPDSLRVPTCTSLSMVDERSRSWKQGSMNVVNTGCGNYTINRWNTHSYLYGIKYDKNGNKKLANYYQSCGV